MSENVKPERDYSKPVSEEQEALVRELVRRVEPHPMPEALAATYRRLLAEFVDRLSAPAAPAPRNLIESPERKPDEAQTPYIARLARHVRAGELTIESALHAALCAPRLGASGKAGWTKEPKEAGWYWLRYDGLQAVHVYQDGHRAYPDGRPVLISSRGTVATLCRNGAEWLPIPVPEE